MYTSMFTPLSCYICAWIGECVYFWSGAVFHGFDKALWFLWREILLLQHTMIFSTAVCLKLCGNRLVKALSYVNVTMPPCTKPGPQRNGFLSLMRKTLTGLHRALTSTPSSIYGLRTGPYRPASVLDLTNGLVAEWEQISISAGINIL